MYDNTVMLDWFTVNMFLCIQLASHRSNLKFNRLQTLTQ